jgi:hypothetical protein
MGTANQIALLLQVDADTAKGRAALDDFSRMLGTQLPQAARQGAEGTSQAAGRVNDALLSNTQSVRLLTSEMGLRLPRAVTSAIAKMLPAIGSLGTALLAAFAIEEIAKFIAWIPKATDQIAGYTAEVKKAYEEDVKANQAALTHFSTVADAQREIAETTRNLGRIAHVTWTEQIVEGTKDAYNETSRLWGPLQGVIALYEGIFQSAGKAADEQVRQLNLLRAQSLGMLSAQETETKHALKMLELSEKAKAAGKNKEEQARIELGILEQKRNLELDIALKEAGKERLAKGIGDVMAEFHRREAEINAEINLEKKQLEIEARHKGVVREFNDVLAVQLQSTRETISAFESHELPARRAIELEIQRQIDTATREINKDKELFAQKKISFMELGRRENEYTQLVKALAAEREAKLDQEAAKEGARNAARINKAIQHRLQEADRARTTATEIQGIEERWSKQSIQANDRIAIAAIESQLKVLHGEQVTQIGRLRIHHDLTKQIIALEQQKIQVQTETEVATIRETARATAQEISLRYQTLVALTKNEAEKKRLTKEAEDERVRIIQQGEKEVTAAYQQSANAQAEAADIVKDANQKQTESNRAQLTSMAEGSVEGIAKMIGGERAYAAVKVAEEVAAGIETLAEGTWPPNPLAITAAALHFESAAQWAIVAGTSASRRGGGGGGTAAREGGSPGPLAAGATGRQVPMQPGVMPIGGSGGGGATLHVIVIGPNEAAGYLCNQVLNPYTQRQGGRLVSSHTINPPKAGR